jgi:hypothetical protein
MKSIFKIKEREFECNFTSPEFARKLEEAVEEFAKRQEEAEVVKDRKYPEIVKTGCLICSKFIDAVFGSGVSESLFKEQDLLEMEGILFEFLEFMKREQERIVRTRAERMLKYKPVLN